MDHLGLAIARSLGLDVVEPETLKSLETERDAIEQRLEAVRDEIASLGTIALDDEAKLPPSLDELLAALEDSREVDARLIRRRLDLQRDLDEGLSPLANDRRLLVPAVLQEIEDHADRLEAQEREISSRTRALSARRDSFVLVVTSLTTCLAGSALAACGWALVDLGLLEFGLSVALAAAIITSLCAAWRFGRSLHLAKGLARARRAAKSLRERGLKLIARVGAPADLEEITASNLRRVVDRVSEREARRECERMLAPYRDDTREKNSLRALLAQLEKPLHHDLSADRDGLPVVPLIRATRAALGLESSWRETLRNLREELIARVEAEARNEIDRGLLEETAARLHRGLERVTARLEDAQSLEDPAARRRLAERLRRDFLPDIGRLLRDAAPSNLDDELCFQFELTPSPSTLALIHVLARIELADASALVGLGRFVVLSSAHLDETDEGRLLEWIRRRARSELTLVAARRGDLSSLNGNMPSLGAVEVGAKSRDERLSASKPHANLFPSGISPSTIFTEEMALAEPAALFSRLQMIDELAPSAGPTVERAAPPTDR